MAGREDFRQEYPLKRALDLGLGLIGLILTLPLWIIIVIAIILEDGGPIFYPQERVGRWGKTFRIAKFRSLKKGADLEVKPWMTPSGKWLTRVGKLLRPTALDELPQLLSIVYGDMSFVGPRAMPVREFEEFKLKVVGLEKRLLVRPGLTGLAQVYGRGTRNSKMKLRYDMLYIRKQGLWLDLKLVLLSVLMSLVGRWDSKDVTISRAKGRPIRKSVTGSHNEVMIDRSKADF